MLINYCKVISVSLQGESQSGLNHRVIMDLDGLCSFGSKVKKLTQVYTLQKI